MASACINNIGMSPEKFPAAAYSSYGWLSPRVSLSREDERTASAAKDSEKEPSPAADPPEDQDPVDFEFRLEDPVAMLSADELFSDGKLVPLKFSGAGKLTAAVNALTETTSSLERAKSCRKLEMEISGMDSYLFSPKAPRCTTRWRELLGLKRLAKNQDSSSSSLKTTPLSSSSPNPKASSLKQLLHRSSKSSTSSSSAGGSSSAADGSSLNLPLLKDSDFSESLSISSSRLSLSSSSSSSGHELDDLPRLSLDLEKPGPNPFAPARSQGLNPNQPRMRLVKPRPSADGRSPTRRRHQAAEEPAEGMAVTVTADSPRLNASGKIVFHGLERSSSSPSSFNGGPRMKHQGMARSYSANVRVPPVLNVPVCSLRGSSKSGLFFTQIFSSSSSSSSSSQQKVGSRGLSLSHGKNRTDRTRLEP